MLPTHVTPETDPCELAVHWTLDLRLATAIVNATRELPFGVRVFSGHRTEEQEDELRKAGRPTAPPGCSTHTTCPATGADVEPTIATTYRVQADFGAAMTRQGLRWGGGSPTDPETGIPTDWKHVDLGPRCTGS